MLSFWTLNTKTMTNFSGYGNGIVRMMFLLITSLILLFPPATAVEVDLPGRDESVIWAGYGEEKLSVVTISGKVLCHDGCYTYEGEKSHLHGHPISGATVGVVCGINNHKVKPIRSWARGKTDAEGEFFVELPSHLHAIPNLEKVCHVKLLHLPKDSACSKATKAKRVTKGIQLMSIEDGARAYTADGILLKPKTSKAC